LHMTEGTVSEMTRQAQASREPVIAILMAVYEPRMDWLKAQLESLEKQTYPNLRLYIRDDCSPTVSLEALEACVRDCVHAIPFELRRNEVNLGSNGTFERLTGEAEGDYFAYCDQDDIWLPQKLETLLAAAEREKALLACSDMFIIDGEGRQTAGSITQVRRHHVFKSGDGLAPQLLISNFAVGCAMLVRSDAAREARPFCPDMVHDHYLALWCAENGRIVSLPDRLICYRIHGDNQTGLMAGVKDRQSYLEVKIRSRRRRLEWLRRRFEGHEALCGQIDRALDWLRAREAYFRGEPGQIPTIWRHRDFGKLVSLFEIVGARLPERFFMMAIGLNRRNII